MSQKNTLNANKVCFVACVNDENQFENYCLAGLRRLIVPEGMTVEVLAIRRAKSMASGYEEARQVSNAKYKVYLHQDLEIVNPNFLIDIVTEFRRNENVGLIGMIGTKRLHPDCVWWDRTDERLVGGVEETFDGERCTNLDFYKFMEDDWERVEAVDGVLMATQYDVPWRTDIMDGWHFYDVSQCLEYIRAGYHVMVPRQKPLWTLHHRPSVMREGWLDLWDKYRRRVMLEYTEEVLPSSRLQDREIMIVVCDHGGKEEEIQARYGYLARLTVPDGYRLSVEVVDDGGPAWSYGKYQKISTAKYKVYLDGDVKITNRRCLVEMIRMFAANRNIGVIGVCEGLFGTVDGRFLAAQYDTPWDDVRYPGNVCFAESMCLDMKQKGFDVIVAGQSEPWTDIEPRKKVPEEVIKSWSEKHLRNNWIWRIGESSLGNFMAEYGLEVE